MNSIKLSVPTPTGVASIEANGIPAVMLISGALLGFGFMLGYYGSPFAKRWMSWGN